MMVGHPGFAAPPAADHPMTQVVGFIQDRRASHAPNIPWQLLHEAASQSGMGLDHPAGEHALVAMQHAHEGGRVVFHTTLVVTDRRLFGRDHVGTQRDETIDIPFAQVFACRLEKKLLLHELHVQLQQGATRVVTFAKELAPFVQGLTRVPVEYRSFAPVPLARTEGDPAGAFGLAQRLLSGDARLRLVLGVLSERVRTGVIGPDEGFDLASRVHILDRELRMGRGMSHGFWLCVLPRPALLHALRAVLGQPVGHFPGPTTDTLDFHAPGDNRMAKAVASSAVGLAFAAVVGVGWVTTPGRPSIRAFRATACDFPCGSGFALQGTMNGQHFLRLSQTNPKFVDAIHQALFRIEARWLLARCLLGTTAAPEQLVWPRRDVVEAKLAEIGTAADVSAFFPPQEAR
jgi:hypothetical protein